jgi:eukaryotic-like serine/threonine-protein kinase
MDVSERTLLHLLEDIKFFRGFNREDLTTLLGSGQWEKAETGRQIIAAGDFDLTMYLLIQGQVEIVYNRRVMSILNPGDTFGEFGLMGEPRTAAAIAKSSCLLLSFNAHRLNLLPDRLQVKLLMAIFQSLMTRLLKVNRRMFMNLPPSLG